MPDWKRTVHRMLAEVERRRESGRVRVAPSAATLISPYRGFGRANELLVRGRVLAEKRITRAKEAEPVWRSLVNAYRRFQSDEVPGAPVRARYRDSVVETVSDDEGYFQVRLAPQEIDGELQWHEVGLELGDGRAPAIAHVLVPSPAAKFGVISDIDDTIVMTGATSTRTMIRNVLLTNAASRTPFEGVADLYRTLQADVNPIFYVSSSPWNLYELLHDYMEIQRIPHGPMFLQDFGLTDETLIHAPHKTHKLEQIRLILEYYPSLPFVLIGDSGQHDPEIYLDVIRSNPGRVPLAIIRDVTPEARDLAVGKIVEEARAAGSAMAYVADSKSAAEAAKSAGILPLGG